MKTNNKKTIVVIDDSEVNLFLIKSLLEENDDLEIFILSESKNAVSVIKEKQPDIIILDLMMPEKNGFEIMEEIKADRNLWEIPIVIISAKKDEETIIKSKQLGAIHFIKKPIDLMEISDTIKMLLDIKNNIHSA